jgi:hypothetical protein
VAATIMFNLSSVIKSRYNNNIEFDLSVVVL